MDFLFPLFLMITTFVFHTDGCGVVTHIEISHRASKYYQDFDQSGKYDYAKLIQQHQDALMGGSPYPDAYYSPICQGGKYHGVSEDTHWSGFINATVNYIRKKYPKPWDEDTHWSGFINAAVNYIRKKYPQPWEEGTEKLIVFTMGVVSHQVADIVWHSLGINQGFLRTMGNIDFHGSFDRAHPVGDFGGDILTEYEMDTSYVPKFEGWYIPTEDLFNIYTEFYGVDYINITCLSGYIPTEDLFNIYTEFYGVDTKMPYDVIVECSVQLYLERLAEQIGAQELYPDYGSKSPFLVDQFERYFLGGLDDMAGWTHRFWQQTAIMMERGTEACYIPHNTLFVQCNVSNVIKHEGPSQKNGYHFTPPNMADVSEKDFVIEKSLRGITLKPSQIFKEKLNKKRNKSKSYGKSLKFQDHTTEEPRTPDKVLYTRSDYARLGESYATGDLNFDGYEDIVVGAPGYNSIGSPQEGRVYIIYGDENGLPSNLTSDLDEIEVKGQGQIIKGWGTAQARLGTSVAVLDINLDGADDIAVGGPAFVQIGDNSLQYNGYILIYFGIPSKKFVASGAANITIACEKFMYCNLGYSMTTSDLNGDGHLDLVLGTPFAPETGEQRGFVAGYLASRNNYGYQYFDVTELKWKLSGQQNYSWFGYDLTPGKWKGQDVLFINQPEYRRCVKPSCVYSENDTQSIGAVQAFFSKNKTAAWTLFGSEQFSQLGWSVSMGNPFIDQSKTVIAVSALGQEVKGSVAGFPVTFPQAGQVLLYSVTETGELVPENTLLLGDRLLGRFGFKVQFTDVNRDGYDDLIIGAPFRSEDATFVDVNRDGYDDLIIGAPFRSEDATEEFYDAEQGQVYIYYGGKSFPYDPSLKDCGNSFIHPCPRLQASLVLEWKNAPPKTRFGSNVALLKGKTGGSLLVTAQHSSDYARLAGAIGVFNF